jgi:putative hemolysin
MESKKCGKEGLRILRKKMEGGVKAEKRREEKRKEDKEIGICVLKEGRRKHMENKGRKVRGTEFARK